MQRQTFARRCAVVSLLSLLALLGTLGMEASATVPTPVPRSPGQYYLTSAEVAQIRKNIVTKVWAKQAWANAKAFADSRLNYSPNPVDPNGNYGGSPPDDHPNWRDDLYIPGINDAHAASGLALSWLVSRDTRYAVSAKRILLAWVRTYTHPPGFGGGVAPAHMVAEPIGPMIKLFITADMLWPTLTSAERTLVSNWARQWINPAESTADSARDSPWVEDTHIGSWTTNAAPYGNSPLGQRAMAMWAAAIAGPSALSTALSWNWQHRTRGGNEYGWLNVIEQSIIPGTGGEMIEGRYRQSVGYGLFGWADLLLIADLAKHAGYPRNLFTTSTPSKKNLLSVGPFYGPLLAGTKPYPYDARETHLDYETQTKQEYRAVFETAYKNCPAKDPVCRYFRLAVTAGGPIQRGNNQDFHTTRWNALAGEVQMQLPKPKPKPKPKAKG